MGRPRFQIRSDPENLRELVVLQETRFLSLVYFCEALEMPEMLEAVKVDDTGFVRLMQASIDDVGVSKAMLARRLAVSPAAVGRWTKGQNHPPSYQRPAIVQEIARMIRAHIDAEYARQKENDAAGVLTLLLGSLGR